MPSVLDDYLDEAQLALELGCNKITLQRYRKQGIGPAFTMVGKRRYLYRREAVREWLLKRECIKAPDKPRGRETGKTIQFSRK